MKNRTKKRTKSGNTTRRLRPANQSNHVNGDNGPILITGGAGFIGTNLAHWFLSKKQPVVLYDNLSRPSVELNLKWLRETHGSLVQFMHEDVRVPAPLRRAVRLASQVFHFAAQVAVTTSLENPIEDFEINARGTLNLLESLRRLANPPPLLFTSTNKVYGDMSGVRLLAKVSRYEPEDVSLRNHGFSEEEPIHFHSPYGCSKGCAEQYVLDYARTFGMRTAVFRMSCIYGPHQFGNEDQGWVAHFLIQACEGKPITLYGDGRQVRDILFVEDLIDAFVLAQQNIEKLSGQVFNIGGGPSNTTSLLELLDLIGQMCGRAPECRSEDWRSADQQYYVSDTRKFSSATGWSPRVNVQHGVQKLYEWLQQEHVGSVERTIANGDANKIVPFRFAATNGRRSRRPPRLKLLNFRKQGRLRVPGVLT